MSPTPSLLTEDAIPSSGAADTVAGDATLAEPTRPDRGGRGRVQRGAMLGRYIVLETLGRGAMGIVYAAYDPELDRKVALKLLLPGRDGGVAARIRLQREAQAIARLSHPNVVAVHDVGAVDERVFIAMELVEGVDLARWRASQPRSAAEILECFVQAGAGLAAAHAADLVHRDFKPENVLVGHDGRARVVDFGLVRKDDTHSLPGGVAADELPVEVSQRRASSSTHDVRLTDAGAMVGTPAYMSPEQFLGQPGDPRSDQFSFCVALYEALYGERPFEGENVAELSYAVLHDEVRSPPAQHEVSGRLRRVLLRGLARDMDARYPSMEALLAALRTAVAPRRQGWVAAGVLVLGVGVGLGVWALGTQERACEGVASRAAVGWSAARQEALQRQFERTALPFAADTWTRVHGHVDGEVQRWGALQRQVCTGNERLERAAAAADPRQLCLDERLDELTNLLLVLEDADARVVTDAIRLVHGLGAVEDCADVDATLAPPRPSDPALRTRVQELRAELQRWQLRTSVGLDPESTQTLQELVDQAEALGYPPLRAEVWVHQSEAAAKQGEVDQAVELENRAFEAGLASRHDLVAFRAASGLLFLHGVTRRDAEPAHGWARRAEALHQRIGGSPSMRVGLLSAWASTYALAGDDEPALALYEEALELVRRLDDASDHATVLNNMGAFHAERRRLPEALRYLEDAAARNEALYGPGHPSTLRTRANVGMVSVMDGRYEEGRERLEAVLPLQEALLGPSHPEVANTLESLASALARTGGLEPSEMLRRRVLEIRVQVFGPRSSPVFLATANLGNALLANDAYAEARTLMLELVAELDEGEPGPRILVQALCNLAYAMTKLGEPAEALPFAQRAVDVCTQSGKCGDDFETSAWAALGQARLDSGDRRGAKQAFEEVVRRPVSPFSPWVRASGRFGLARATLADDRAAALALARQALEEVTAAEEPSQALGEEIEAWLRTQADTGPG